MRIQIMRDQPQRVAIAFETRAGSVAYFGFHSGPFETPRESFAFARSSYRRIGRFVYTRILAPKSELTK